MEQIKKKPRAKVAHSWGAKDIANWKFQENSLPTAWAKHLGDIPQRFLMYVDGEAGNGKTEYQMQISKMLSQHYGKVRFNNVEQGKHVQIKQSAARNNFSEIKAGKWVYCSIKDFDKLKEQLKRPNSGRVIIVDSISYFPLTVAQVQELINIFPNKSFIFIAYQVHYNHFKPVRHLCDIKIRVENFIATVQASRFGGTEEFVIWDRPKKTNGQLTLVA